MYTIRWIIIKIINNNFYSFVNMFDNLIIIIIISLPNFNGINIKEFKNIIN